MFFFFVTFPESCHGFLARHLSCFRPGRSKNEISACSVGTEKLRDEQLGRFVVVSSREVPS